jgi:hypothetical protein
MYLDRRLPFQEARCVCDAVLRRDAQTQVHVIRHRVPLHQFHSMLFAQTPQDLANVLSKLPKDQLFPVFRDEYQMISAVPSDV